MCCQLDANVTSIAADVNNAVLELHMLRKLHENVESRLRSLRMICPSLKTLTIPQLLEGSDAGVMFEFLKTSIQARHQLSKQLAVHNISLPNPSV